MKDDTTRATSETIATILMVSVVVLLASVLFIAFTDVVQRPDESAQAYAIDAQETDDSVVFTFNVVRKGDDLTVIAGGLPIGTVTNVSAGDQFRVAGVDTGETIRLVTRTEGGDERVIYRHEVSEAVPPEKPVLYLTGTEGTSYYAPSEFKSVPKPDHFDIVVAKDGSGDYTSVQAAVDNATAGDDILIKHGTYDEQVDVTVSDLTLYGPNATLRGPGSSTTSQGIDVNSANPTVIGLTIKNYGDGVRIRSSDGASFWNVYVHSNSDAFDARDEVDDLTVRQSVVSNNGHTAFTYEAESCAGGPCTPTGWTIVHNEIVNNPIFIEVVADGPSEQVVMDFEENWWGSDSGPDTSVYYWNSESGNIEADYEPYCTTENCSRLSGRDTDSP